MDLSKLFGKIGFVFVLFFLLQGIFGSEGNAISAIDNGVSLSVYKNGIDEASQHRIIGIDIENNGLHTLSDLRLSIPEFPDVELSAGSYLPSNLKPGEKIANLEVKIPSRTCTSTGGHVILNYRIEGLELEKKERFYYDDSSDCNNILVAFFWIIILMGLFAVVAISSFLFSLETVAAIVFSNIGYLIIFFIALVLVACFLFLFFRKKSG